MRYLVVYFNEWEVIDTHNKCKVVYTAKDRKDPLKDAQNTASRMEAANLSACCG